MPSSKYCGSERKSAESEVKTRPISEEFEDRFQYGVISPPKNRHFVAKLTVKRPGYQRIPGDVISVFNLRIPGVLKLLDEEGREWTAEVKHWKDGRVWISTGWRAFCKWNRLRLYDRCICEFIQRNRKIVHLKTRIVRNRSWLPNTKKNPVTRERF